MPVPMNISKYSEIVSDDFSNQTIAIKADDYDDFQTTSKKKWAKLPDSVIGTLFYFLKVEQNSPNFDILSTFKAIFLIGFPTYVTYCVQFLFVYGLYTSVYTETEVEGKMENQIADSICGVSPFILCAAIFTYILSMIPTYKGIIQACDIVLFSRRVAYTETADDGTVYITNLLGPMSKRITIFLFVNLFEVVLVLCLSYTGVGFILSSEGVDDILMNSLAVVFVMTIDDMAKDAFQSDDISAHIDSFEFETSALVDEDINLSTEGKIRAPTFNTYTTLWSIDQCFLCVLATFAIVYSNVYAYCKDV